MPKKQKDGRYRAQMKIGVDENGKDIIRYFSAPTKEKLENERQNIREYYLQGGDMRADRLFSDYAIEWYQLVKEPVLSESSKQNYLSMMNKHVLPYFGRRHLRAISPQDVQRWINQFAGKGKSSIDQAASIVRNVFGAAFQDGILERDPTARLVIPRAGRAKKRRALTKNERKSIEKTIATHEHGLYLAVLYYMGLRRGEALGLQWGDIDWETSKAHIQRDIDFTKSATDSEGDLKTDESDRFVYIPSDLRNMMVKRRGLPGMYVFHTPAGKPLSKSTSERIWIDLMIDAGFAEPIERDWKHKDARALWDPVLTPHFLRHNYITMLREAGIDPVTAMRLAGHREYRTTLQIYTHVDKQNLDGAGGQIETFLGNPAETLPDKKKEI